MISARAPGRVNLIGSHTDSQDGYVLPVAMQLEVRVDGEVGGDRLRLASAGFEGVVDMAADGSDMVAGDGSDSVAGDGSDSVAGDGSDMVAGDGSDMVAGGWARYPAGVVWALAEAGRPPVGFTGEITSTLPPEVGLSSSAALEVAVAMALAAAADWSVEPLPLARLCRRAENEGAGVPCGIMDQAIAVLGSPGGARLIDCRTLEHRLVPLPETHRVVVVDSGATRALGQSPFGARTDEVRAAAAALGVASLRDATLDVLDGLPDRLRRRARHVVTENARVLAAADALAAGDLDTVGRLFAESHRSDVEDWEAGHPDVDALVEQLVGHPAVAAARMTGGGFGGCVVAVAAADRVEDVLRSVLPLRGWVVDPSAGADVVR